MDLSQVTGTGEDGKITKADILRAMNPAVEQPVQAASAVAQDTIIPMDGVRKLIADNMQASLNNAAQLSVFVELDVTEMVGCARACLSATSAIKNTAFHTMISFPMRPAVRLSVTPS